MKEPCACGDPECPQCALLLGPCCDPGELDGDHESGLAAAGFGTDEDYEHYDDGE